MSVSFLTIHWRLSMKIKLVMPLKRNNIQYIKFEDILFINQTSTNQYTQELNNPWAIEIQAFIPLEMYVNIPKNWSHYINRHWHQALGEDGGGCINMWQWLFSRLRSEVSRVFCAKISSHPVAHTVGGARDVVAVMNEGLYIELNEGEIVQMLDNTIISKKNSFF